MLSYNMAFAGRYIMWVYMLNLTDAIPWPECFANIPAKGKNCHVDIDKMNSP